MGAATGLFIVLLLFCCCVRGGKKRKRQASVYVRDVDDEVPEGEKAKKLRLISAKGDETGVLVTANSVITSPRVSPRSKAVMQGISINRSLCSEDGV